MIRFRFNTHTALATLTVTAAVCIVSVGLLSKPEPVQAFPAYKDKEGVNCAYCHTSPAGGKRSYRGKFYKKNGLSFAGFDDKAEADAAGVPLGAEADAKPKSLTPPVAGTTPAASPTPVASPAPVASPVAAPTVAELRVKAIATETALKKTPTVASAKKAHSASLAALARAVMGDAAIPPAKKYPESLRLLRKAATLDPANKGVVSDIKQIEAVYKQMGKPVPK